MSFYVSEKALVELNERGYTAILNADGSPTDGELNVVDDDPKIFNLFDMCETIYLDYLKVRYDGVVMCGFTTDGQDMGLDFEVIRTNDGYKRKWVRN